MNLSNKIFQTFVLFLIITYVIGQTTQKPKKKKSSKKKPASFKNRAFCLSCLQDYKNKPFDPRTDTCTNPLGNITDAELRFLHMCSESAKFCAVDIQTVNGVLFQIERRCASSTCMEGCLRDGYGAENENCVYCCPPFMGPEYFDEESFQECPRFDSATFNKLNLELISLIAILSIKKLLIKEFANI